MFYKKGEVRPYVIGNVVSFGKIIKVDTKKEVYTIQNLETKEQFVLSQKDIFIGDD